MAEVQDYKKMTLGDLAEVAEFKMTAEWDKVAMICLVYAQAQSKGRVDPLNFHPIRRAKRQVSEARTLEWMESVKDRLPQTLNEDEIKKRWEEFDASNTHR